LASMGMISGDLIADTKDRAGDIGAFFVSIFLCF